MNPDQSSPKPETKKSSNADTPLFSKNPFSRFFFHYAFKVLRDGNDHLFQESDLYKLDDKLRYEAIFADFEKYRHKNPRYSYSKAFTLWMIKETYLMVIGQLVLNCLTVLNPFFLKALINWFVNSPRINPNYDFDQENWKGYVYSSVLFIAAMSRPFVNQQSIYYGYEAMIKVYALVFGTYFNKFRTISMSASRYLNIGLVASSITADATKIIILLMTYANLVVGPVLMIIYLVIICIEIGWIGVIGMLVILVITVFQIIIGRQMEYIAREKSVYLDIRNKQINNALTGIKTIKFSNWEKIVISVINKVRLVEKKLSMSSTFIRGVVDALSFIMPLLASFVSIWIYQAIYETLSLGSIFYVLSVYNMTTVPLRIFFFAIITMIEARIGLERIGKFGEFPNQTPQEDMLWDDDSVPFGAISIKNATLTFENEEIKTKVTYVSSREKKAQEAKKKNEAKQAEGETTNSHLIKSSLQPKSSIIFKNLSLDILPGEFVAVIGKVGSGKTSLLKSILGGLFYENGSITKNGRVAYIPQESFLINGLLRDNILFGSAFDEEKYSNIIHACELLPDIRILPGGDMTEIGERGINLSGGQKQRIAIARALYAGADIFLIDDSLSAVDAHVGQNLFNNVFKTMLAGKTIVMVTHALQYLSEVDRVIMLENGEVVADGHYKELKDINARFTDFVKESENKDDKTTKQKADSPKETLRRTTIRKNEPLIRRSEINFGDSAAKLEEKNVLEEKPVSPKEHKELIKEGEKEPGVEIADKNQQMQLEKLGKLTKKESRFAGQIGLGLYYRYFSKGNIFYFLVCMTFFGASIAGRILADWWVGSWSSKAYPNFSFTQSLLIYFGIAMVTFVLLIIRSLLWSHYMSRISYRIFDDLINRIMGKKMIFFDTTPLGQVLNLTSKDTDLVDLNIPSSYLNFIANILQVIGIFVLVAISNVILIPIIVGLMIFDGLIVRRYLRVSMELRRLEQISFSPILSNIMELYNGLPIFRAFNKTEFQQKVYTSNVNKMLSICFHDRMITIYTNFLTEITIALLIGATLYLLCIGKTYQLEFVIANGTLIALTISWILSIPLLIQFMMFMFAETAKGMSSVQRMMKNIDKSNMEKATGELTPPENWPERGEIRAVNVSARYRPKLPLVVKNASFYIRSCEKIGIVGRTGSGKSTTILLLTRLLEVENDQEGFIEIDGYKIHKIDLDTLRSNIKVIPQDPYILKGTLRSNIDPYDKFSDERVVEALKKSLLWDSDFFSNKLGIEKRAQLRIAKYKSSRSQHSDRQLSIHKMPQERPLAGEDKQLDHNSSGVVIENGELNFREATKLAKPFSKKQDARVETKERGLIVPETNHNENINTAPIKITSRRINSNRYESDVNVLMEDNPDEVKQKLNFEIEDAGKNLSVGEKQLVCIARALLDVPKILLMDEATSNIDQFTDLQIQEVIKHEFKNTTIITIAHRLNTIIQYDRIFVMQAGEIIEQGSPVELLTRESAFRDMVRENGTEYEEKLLKLATNLDLSILDEFSQELDVV